MTKVKAAAAAAAISCLLLSACAATGQSTESEAPDSAQQSSEQSYEITFEWDSSEPSSAGQPEQVDVSKIKGIKKTSLTKEEKEILGPFLAARLNRQIDLGKADFKIVERKSDAKGYKLFTLTDKTSGKSWDIYVGDNWRIDAARDWKEVTEETPPAKAEEIEKELEQVNQQDQYGHADLYSTKTDFNEKDAVELSKKDEVDKLIGLSIRKRLLADVGSYLSPAGISLDDASKVLVSKKGISEEGGVKAFRIMVKDGPGKIVIEAKYETSGTDYGFTKMP